jgi:hypothetical protein
MRPERHSGLALGRRGPLAGGVDYSHNPNGIVAHFVNQAVVPMSQYFACIRKDPGMSGQRKLFQPSCGLAKCLIDAQSRSRIIDRDVFPYVSAVILRVG